MSEQSEIPQAGQTWPSRENLGPAPTTAAEMIRDLIKYGGSTPKDRYSTIDTELRAIYSDKSTEPFIRNYCFSLYSLHQQQEMANDYIAPAESISARLRHFSLGARLAVDSVISSLGDESVQHRLFRDVDYWQASPLAELEAHDQLEYVYYFEQHLTDHMQVYDQETCAALEEFIAAVLGEEADAQSAHNIIHGFCVVGDAVLSAHSNPVQ